MGRSQANLKLDVFDGLRGLSKDAKLLYFALLVEPTVNQAGVGALRERRWAKDTELTATEVGKALQELDAKYYVLVDEDTEEVLVRTIIRRDGVAEQPNLLWAACRAAPLLRSVRLRRVLAAELRKLPPKPPPTQGKNGRLYEHPDPHATADAIDPAPSPDPTLEGFDNGSQTVVEPFSNPSKTEGFEKGSRTPGGGGGGGSTSRTADVDFVPTAPRKRGTRIPDDFEPTPAMITWARATTPDVDPKWATEKFADYWQSKAGKDALKIDWPKTWKNWMRTEQEQAARRRQPRLHAVGHNDPAVTGQRRIEY